MEPMIPAISCAFCIIFGRRQLSKEKGEADG
jgi:hypothetical protein